MQLTAVRQYSLAEGGLDATAVDSCMVAAEPKAALIALLFADPAELEPQPAEPQGPVPLPRDQDRST